LRIEKSEVLNLRFEISNVNSPADFTSTTPSRTFFNKSFMTGLSFSNDGNSRNPLPLDGGKGLKFILWIVLNSLYNGTGAERWSTG
jgi:hypothetical protein